MSAWLNLPRSIRGKPRVLEMSYFGGLDREEINGHVVDPRDGKRDLRLGEAWLRRYLSGKDPDIPDRRP